MVVALKRSVAIVVVLVIASAAAQAAQLQARFSVPVVSEGQEVTLQLRAPANGSVRAPDLSPLEADFEILGSQQSQRVSIVNGRRDASIDWTVTLLPRRLGEIVVPPLKAGSAVSPTLRLEVTQAGPSPTRKDAPDLFVESTVDQISPYVQSEVRYTVKVYDGIGILGGSLTEPDVGNHARVTPIGEGRTYEEAVEGRPYRVHEREYLIRPQTSGPLEIGRVTLEARVPDPRARRRSPFGEAFSGDPFFGGLDAFAGMGGMGSSLFDRMMNPGRSLRTHSNAIELEVQPRPTGATEGWFLPAKRVEVVDSFEPALATARVGEALTRTVELRAWGASVEQLPELSIPAPAGVRQYDEGSRRETIPTEDGMVAVRQEAVALVASEPGWIEFPAIEVRWWDTDAEKERVATLASRRVEVAPALGAATARVAQTLPSQSTSGAESETSAPVAGGDEGSDPAAAPGSDSQMSLAAASGAMMWFAVAIAFLAGFGGAAVFLRRRRAARDEDAPTPVRPGEIVRELECACRENDAVRVREQFVAWGRERWGTAAPMSPRLIALRLGDDALAAEVAKLDRSLYAPRAVPFEGALFWSAFRPVSRSRTDGASSPAPSILPQLYPSP